jgi:copper chaperone
MAKTTVKIIGLKCPGCSGRVKRTIAALPGVNNADVVLETGLLTVDYDEAQREAASLAEEVRALGFKVADDPVAAG